MRRRDERPRREGIETPQHRLRRLRPATPRRDERPRREGIETDVVEVAAGDACRLGGEMNVPDERGLKLWQSFRLNPRHDSWRDERPRREGIETRKNSSG